MSATEAFSGGAVLLDTVRMSAADAAAVAAGSPVATLMRNAGAAVAREVVRRFAVCPVVVLCGPGNNGGDGLVAARELKLAGWPVQVALLGPREMLKGAAGEQAQRWGGDFRGVSADVLMGSGLVIDALFGAGFRGELSGAVRDTLMAAVAMGLPIVAVDVPSGLDGNTGESHGAIAAALTVTFFRRKPGHLLFPGRQLCGETVVADIGIPGQVLEALAPDTFANEPDLWREQLPFPRPTDYKYRRGHALIVGGYPLTGAARMAARAAARIGAGLTTLAVPEQAFAIYAATQQSIMVRPLAVPEDFTALVADPRISAWLIGPGAGPVPETRERVLAALATGSAVVVDADGLTAFGAEPQVLFGAIHGPCVMTPHDGEYPRLFSIVGDRLTRARLASKLSGAILVLKGPDTVIAAPDGRAIINANAPPTLATAGSGDVLSGIITGLIAQGMDAWLGAAAAVWLHGAAATAFGPGLIAEDLPELLPQVLRTLQRDPAART